MKLIILAFILSLSLHFLFFKSTKTLNKEIKPPINHSKEIIKSKIKYVKLLKKEKILKKPIVKKSHKAIKKEISKKSKAFIKVDKKKVITQKRLKKTKKTIPKVKVKQKPIFVKKSPPKYQEKRKSIEKKSLENFLLSEPIPLDINMLDNITKSYLKLYGEEYNSFTKVQKVFLQKNLKDIGKITQRYLEYPRIAIQIEQEGMNIVEFFLYPNGDISDLKIVYSSGYSVLDKNSIETIEIAYKDYPRPKTKTKIKIYIFYKLY